MRITRALPLLLSLCAALCLAPGFARAQSAYPPSEALTYTDIFGGQHSLRAFPGRKVRYALPEAWVNGSPQSLTPAEMVTLVERTDQLYELMTAVIASEPEGPGILTIAAIPLPSGEGGVAGRAVAGQKKCEISTAILAGVKRSLAAGRLDETIRHELAHTFDVYHNYIFYYPDSSHAWVDFWLEYGEYLTRAGPYTAAPDLVLRAKALDWTLRYDSLATPQTWARCIKPGSVCEGERVFANKVFAGLFLRYERLHGQAALARAFAFYRGYGAVRTSGEMAFESPEFKSDLLAEALSHGINADATPELDAWFWPVADEVRRKLRTAYPQANPFVADADGDGWTPLRGDRDDRDPTVHPGATETLNGKDDDCNGYVDDILRPAGPTLFTPPARLTGRLQFEQSHSYRFEAEGPMLLVARTTAGEWGGLVSITREGEAVPILRAGVVSTSSTVSLFRLEGRGPWGLSVQATSGGGDYEVVIVPGQQISEGTGSVFALPLRVPGSARERTLVPGGMARAVGTLPGAIITTTDARPDGQGRWPTSLAGVEVRVAGQAATLLAVRPAGANTYAVDFVTPEQVTPAASGPRVPVLVQHMPSGAQWQLDTELLEIAPALWGRQDNGQNPPAAIALGSPTFMAFDGASPAPAALETRVIVFASSLGVGRTVGNTRLVAQLADGSRVTLPAEHVGLTSLPGLYQIVFKVSPALAGQSRVLLSVEGSEEVRVALYLR